MENVDEDPDEAPGRSVLPETQEANTRVSTKGEADPNEEGDKQSKREREQEQPKRIINLQRELTTYVTNIQTAADAKELERRAELEEARRIRRERQDNDVKSSQEKFDEIIKSWSTLGEKVIPQDLREALNNHQHLCDAIIADKKKLINDLQQELKKRDDHYVKTLRKNEEEIDLLIERMEEQIKTLTQAYREALGQTEMVDQQETEVSLAEYKAEWQQEMKELWNKQITRLTERREEVEKYDVKLHHHILKDMDSYYLLLQEENAFKFKMEREHQQMKGADKIMKLQTQNKKDQLAKIKTVPFNIKNKIYSLQTERKVLKNQHMRQQKELAQKRHDLSEEYKRAVQQYERLQKQVRHFAVADARKFQEMQLMAEAERKQQVEKALAMELQICKHLGIAWKRPPIPFMEHSSPIYLQKQAHMADHQEEEGEFTVETMKKVMELLCDEAGFLIEGKLLKLVAPLKKEEQAVVKLAALFHSLGIEDEDVPKLADFLLKYKQEQGVPTESFDCLQDVQPESSDVAKAADTSASIIMSPEPIHYSHVLPALRSFLEQCMASKESSTHQRSSVGHAEARDASDYKAYWEQMANIISEDTLRMWDAAEKKLRQYHAVLTDISELHSQNERLKQQNTELRRRVQQISSS